MLPKGFRPWGKRKRFTWAWGDGSGEIFEAGKEYGAYLHSAKRTYLHPHLRRPEYHDFLWDVKGHEALHAILPGLSHARIEKLERLVGQYLHDLSGCRKCD